MAARHRIGASALLLSVVAAVLVVSGAYGPQEELRLLTDRNFEHDTQAGTGQTTGHWLVLFTKKGSSSSRNAEEVVIRAAAELEGQPIFAKVDIDESPETAARFEVDVVPQLRLFRDRSMVIYAGNWDADDILIFIREGWKALPTEVVPKEASFQDRLLARVQQLRSEFAQFFLRFPMLLAIVGSIVALAAYTLTQRFLYSKAKKTGGRKRRLPPNVSRRMKNK